MTMSAVTSTQGTSPDSDDHSPSSSYEERYHRGRHGRLLDDERFFLFSVSVARRKYLSHCFGDLLEMGCGVGRNIVGTEAVGTDISMFALKAAKKRGLRISFSRFPFT